MLAGGGSQTALVASLTKSPEYVQLRIGEADWAVLGGRGPDARGISKLDRADSCGADAGGRRAAPVLFEREFLGSFGRHDPRVCGRRCTSRFFWVVRPRPCEDPLVGGRQDRQWVWVAGEPDLVLSEAASARAGSHYYQLFAQASARPTRGAGELGAGAADARGEGAVRVGIAGEPGVPGAVAPALPESDAGSLTGRLDSPMEQKRRVMGAEKGPAKRVTVPSAYDCGARWMVISSSRGLVALAIRLAWTPGAD